MFEDNIILRIKRKFTDDEEIKLLIKTVTELKYELGVLKSELEEKRHQLSKYNNTTIEEDGKTKKVWMQCDLFSEFEKRIQHQKNINDKLNKQLSDYHSKYFALLNKVNNEHNQRTDTQDSITTA